MACGLHLSSRMDIASPEFKRIKRHPRLAKHAEREVHLFDGKVVAEEELKRMADVEA